MSPGTHCFPYQTYESRTLFFMTSLQYHCILGLTEIKTASQRQNYAQKMQDAQVKKSLQVILLTEHFPKFGCEGNNQREFVCDAGARSLS